MLKKNEKMVKKVLETMTYSYVQFESVEFAEDEFRLYDGISFRHAEKCFYITDLRLNEKESDIFIYDSRGEIKYCISSCYKSQVEKATILCMAICQLTNF